MIFIMYGQPKTHFPSHYVNYNELLMLQISSIEAVFIPVPQGQSEGANIFDKCLIM